MIKDSQFLNKFEGLLHEAIVWCTRQPAQSQNAESLRTLALRPANLCWNPAMSERPLHQIEASDKDLIWEQIITARIEIVLGLATGRRCLLNSMKQPERVRGTGSYGGRLLIFNPDHSLADGAAHIESDGFFDAENNPPWDTWLCYLKGQDANAMKKEWKSFLVSWVPPDYLERVRAGIAVNAEECIQLLPQTR